MTEEELEEFWRIYKPQEAAGPTEYRAYYDPETFDIICFSEEKLNIPYSVITKEEYFTFRPDLYYVKDGKLEKRIIQLINGLLLKPNGSKYASIKNHCQFAVDDSYTDEKSFWDPIQ